MDIMEKISRISRLERRAELALEMLEEWRRRWRLQIRRERGLQVNPREGPRFPEILDEEISGYFVSLIEAAQDFLEVLAEE